ncbi:hypothetical protein GIB67_022762 [Kingdonia uniflora]|uniref:Pentatricopeptide repeat-containing protein n=1 Tax=Kingdonia uniflora TaxID=39325 RepID=A0A7J7LJS9_9MAGN|nr:hypothetical protein GIB67_022762 [Kingdonia uniflora]
MYTKCGNVEVARVIFDKMVVKNSMSWNTMIDGYMRNGGVDERIDLFDRMPVRDKVSWTALISGFVKRDRFEEALDWFRKMQISGVEPDYVTVITVLVACANLGALGLGIWVHWYVLQKGFDGEIDIFGSMKGLSWFKKRSADSRSYLKGHVSWSKYLLSSRREMEGGEEEMGADMSELYIGSKFAFRQHSRI